jgi:5-methylcytosine-specific restriction endonuclease McrA
LSKVFVLDSYYKPLNPVHPARARLLLTSGKAAVFRRYPFTLILKRGVEHPEVQPFRLKLDPGSKTTGIAIVNDQHGEVVFAAELSHRGQTIKGRLDQRRSVRRNRRQRKTRYRKPRFKNRPRRKGWLAPSLESRIQNVLTWTKRFMRLCPITAISQELVRFDMQAMENPEIRGIEYQQGTLLGYEVRQYLLEKWGRACSYCGKQDTPLQVEHIHPRANGGTHRVSNLCLACQPCNKAKGTQDIAVFLAKKPEVLKRILAQAKAPLQDAAAVNATRWALSTRLKEVGLPLEIATGGRTKYNRAVRGLPKTHWLDAACVGASTPEFLEVRSIVPLLITSNGHGSRQMCRMDRYGFVRTSPKQARRVKGFRTGDIVKATVPSGKKAGTYVGRVAVRTTGFFNITTSLGTVEGISYRSCTAIHQCDGYNFGHGTPTSLAPNKERLFPPHT